MDKKAEFKIEIMGKYFDSKKHKKGTNPRGAFCLRCAYQKDVRKAKHVILRDEWLKKNNAPDFGYKNPLNGSWFFYNQIKKMYNSEEFIFLAPDWREYINSPEEPELFTEETSEVKEVTLKDIYDLLKKFLDKVLK